MKKKGVAPPFKHAFQKQIVSDFHHQKKIMRLSIIVLLFTLLACNVSAAPLPPSTAADSNAAPLAQPEKITTLKFYAQEE